MAKQTVSKARKNNNNRLLIGVFGVLLVLIIVAVTIIVILGNRPNPNGDMNFFETDDTKYVVAIDYNEGNELSPVKSYDVYYHDDGNEITGHESYYEFVDEETARAAFPDYEKMKAEDVDFIGDVKLDGKYIIMIATPRQYEGLTLEFVKEWSRIDVSELESSEDEEVIEGEDGQTNDEVAPCDDESTDC